MKTGDHIYSIRQKPKEKTLRKTAQTRAAHAGRYLGKLSWCRSDATDLNVHFIAKSPPQSGRLAFVPITSFEEFESGRGQKYNI
jgi:hypothetical protein